MPGQDSVHDNALRWLGVLLLILVFADSVLGIVAAGRTISLASTTLVIHVVVGAGLIAMGAYALAVAFRLPNWPGRLATLLTFGASLSAATVASLSLIGVVPQAPLLDRVLALVALGGAALMIAFGSAQDRPARK